MAAPRQLVLTLLLVPGDLEHRVPRPAPQKPRVARTDPRVKLGTPESLAQCVRVSIDISLKMARATRDAAWLQAAADTVMEHCTATWPWWSMYYETKEEIVDIVQAGKVDHDSDADAR